MTGFLDWCFRDRRTGRIVIGQAPNLPLWLFGAAALAELASPAGTTAERAFLILSRLFLAWWAVDELIRGVNPWRRMLGAGVLAYLVVATMR